MSTVIGPIICATFIFLIIGIIISLNLKKKNNIKDAKLCLGITIITAIIIFSFISYAIYSIIQEEKERDLVLVVDPTIPDNDNFNNSTDYEIIMKFGDEEKIINHRKERIKINDIKIGKKYYFEIYTSNISFADGTNRITGFISLSGNDKLKMSNLNLTSNFNTTKEDDWITISSKGDDGEIKIHVYYSRVFVF